MVIFVGECPAHAAPCVQYSLHSTFALLRCHGDAVTRRLGVRSVARSRARNEQVLCTSTRRTYDQVMGRRVQNTDDEDSDSGDKLDFSKQRQQLKQQRQQQQPTPTRTSTVALLPGLLAVENGEDGEEERSGQTHVTQHHTSALCEACRAGDVEALRRLLALPGTQVGAANADRGREPASCGRPRRPRRVRAPARRHLGRSQPAECAAGRRYASAAGGPCRRPRA